MTRYPLLKTVLFVLAAVLFMGNETLDAGIERVWALDDGEKVGRDDLSHPLADNSSNTVWEGGSIHLFGAKNEIIAFQLIIQADVSGADNVNVTFESLANGPYTIENTGSADPFDYIGKRIELFTEHYLDITNRTTTSWHWWTNAMAMDIRGDEYLGWIPDALIPFEAPSGLGGAPFDIAPDSNQGVWVDIYIPRDAPAGIYAGILEVSINSSPTHSIPVYLRVYDFILPDETHFKNFFHGDWQNIINKHGGTHKSPEYYELEGRYHQMAHRHRIDLTLKVDLIDMDDHYQRYMTGAYYANSYNYDGPGKDVGHGTYSIGTYAQDRHEFSTPTEAAWWAASDAWVNWFDQNAPDVEIFKYMYDEPYFTGGLDSVQERCNWIDNNPGPGKRLMTYCTIGSVMGPLRTDFEGLIDFWSVTSQAGYEQDNITWGYVIPAAQELQAMGSKIAFYNGTRPSFGTIVVDTDAIDFRINPWIAWKYKTDQYFLWHTNFYNRDAIPFNPFVDNYRSYTGGRIANGNGTLFYPGEDKEFPQDDRGLRGPISSIRMKNWRRGQQDYEYLWLARQAGLDNEISGIVDTVVPKAQSECDSQSAPAPWAVRGYVFEEQRKQIAELIEIQEFMRKSIAIGIWQEKRKDGCSLAMLDLRDKSKPGDVLGWILPFILVIGALIIRKKTLGMQTRRPKQNN